MSSLAESSRPRKLCRHSARDSVHSQCSSKATKLSALHTPEVGDASSEEDISLPHLSAQKSPSRKASSLWERFATALRVCTAPWSSPRVPYSFLVLRLHGFMPPAMVGDTGKTLGTPNVQSEWHRDCKPIQWRYFMFGAYCAVIFATSSPLNSTISRDRAGITTTPGEQAQPSRSRRGQQGSVSRRFGSGVIVTVIILTTRPDVL